MIVPIKLDIRLRFDQVDTNRLQEAENQP